MTKVTSIWAIPELDKFKEREMKENESTKEKRDLGPVVTSCTVIFRELL